MAGQSWTVGQEQLCKNRLQFKNVMDGWMDGLVTDGPTDRHGKVRDKKLCSSLNKDGYLLCMPPLEICRIISRLIN